jgi:uncharacterized membrane protein
MSYGYRFSAWLIEMLVDALLFSIVAIIMSHAGYPTARDIAALTVAALTSFGVSGFAITTFVLRLALRGRGAKVYPIIAPLLFLIHFEVMNLMVPGGLMDSQERFLFRVIGSGVVLVVATAISLLLKRTGSFGSAVWLR